MNFKYAAAAMVMMMVLCVNAVTLSPPHAMPLFFALRNSICITFGVLFILLCAYIDRVATRDGLSTGHIDYLSLCDADSLLVLLHFI